MSKQLRVLRAAHEHWLDAYFSFGNLLTMEADLGEFLYHCHASSALFYLLNGRRWAWETA